MLDFLYQISMDIRFDVNVGDFVLMKMNHNYALRNGHPKLHCVLIFKRSYKQRLAAREVDIH